ncbi:MAG: hypothetical protein AB7S77_11190 [Desulfatirhabdiaceae bacterium]
MMVIDIRVLVIALGIIHVLPIIGFTLQYLVKKSLQGLQVGI